MISQRKLFDIYRGAQLPESTAALAGANAGAMGTRGLLLAQLMQQNKIKVQDLSPQDAALAGQNMDKTHPGESQFGKVLGGVGGFFGNLGSDVWSATKGLAPGIFKAGKAVAYDVSHPFTAFGGFGPPGEAPSHINRDIVKPQEKYFKEQYGQGNVFNNFYQHPLGPLLDVATVASLGAGGVARGGSALSRAGKISPESRLATLASTKGRAPLLVDKNVDEGVVSSEFPRDYSSRPLRKGIQVATDKIGEKIPALQRGQLWATTNSFLKKGSSIKDSEALQNIQRQVSQLIPVMKDLTPEEGQAFDLVARGINSPEWLAEYENAIKRSQANDLPEELGANRSDFGKLVKPELAQSRAALPDAVKELAIDPAKSDRLMTALQSYHNIVNERIVGDLDPEVARAKANELRDALTSLREQSGGAPAADTFSQMHRIDQNKFNRAADEGVYVDDLMHDTGAPAAENIPQTNAEHPFPEPTIAPAQVARNWEWHEPSRLGQIFGKEAGWNKKQGPFSPSNVTYQNVLQEPFNTYRPNASPLLAGVQRPDLRQFADLIAKHERDVVDQAYSAKVINQIVLKDEHGEPITVKSAGEAERKYGAQYTAIHPSAPLHYYQDQTTVADMVSFMSDKGFPVDGPEMRAAIEAVGEDTAMKMTQAARRQDAYVAPKTAVEYQRKIENASAPYESKIGRMGAKALNFWRTYTLSLMPRWALNTAVGSFMLNAIKGVGPKSYMISKQVGKDFIDEEGTSHPGVFESSHAGGVNLGNQVGMELLEPALQAGKMGTNRVARYGMQKVQAIEDYFRRASFVHSVKREAKQALRENGATIAGFEKDRGPRTVDEYRDLILQNPHLVQKAVDDVNRFAYNFAMLGPMERRYVRQIAPFWGWYKFISGVVYKLPIEYPGRANMLSKLGDLGMQSNENLGEMPRWLMGNVLGKPAASGMLHYLSTTGVNPFSQVFNPASPEGIGGVAQLGQASPIIQSILAGFGVDSMSGGSLPVSPEHGVSPDFSGTLRDEKTGEERPVASIDWQGRVLGSLMRSFPEARIGERIRSGGRAVYPESIPLISEYYMPTKPESRYGSGIIEALQQMTGTAVRPFNLQSYQAQRAAGMKYAIRKGARSRAKLKQALKK